MCCVNVIDRGNLGSSFFEALASWDVFLFRFFLTFPSLPSPENGELTPCGYLVVVQRLPLPAKETGADNRMSEREHYENQTALAPQHYLVDLLASEIW